MSRIWIIFILLGGFVAYAYFGFGDQRLYNGRNTENNNATTTRQEANVLLPTKSSTKR